MPRVTLLLKSGPGEDPILSVQGPHTLVSALPGVSLLGGGFAKPCKTLLLPSAFGSPGFLI